MQTAEPVRITDMIDQRRLSRLQKSVMLLCTIIIVLDGFDVQAMAFTAAAVATEYGIAKGDMGPLFAAGLIGMAVGALVVGPLGDRLGRKTALRFSVLTFGIFTLATAFASSYEMLFLLRLLTGIGLGGALPNATALMTEYAPARMRNFAVAVIFLGIPLGGILGGLLAAELIPRYGWPSVFIVGGALPLLLVPLLELLLPESLRFLAMLGERGKEPLLKVIRRLDPAGNWGPEARFESPEAAPQGFPVARLFDAGYARDSLLLWAAFFTNLMVIYFLISWTPLLVRESGFSQRAATQTAVLLNVGGAVGPLLLAWVVARWGSRLSLAAIFVLGGVATCLAGQVSHSLPLLMTLIFFAGFFSFAGQINLNALAASIYPTQSRATGVGWALGIGRLGSILGPLVGGALVGLELGMPVYFVTFGSVLLITMMVLLPIRRHQPPAAQAVAMT